MEQRHDVGILAVCTGNICRSPAVERLLRALLPEGSGVRVESAGFGSAEGVPMDPTMAALVRAEGGVTAGFGSRWVTEEQVHDADLVLALTRAHRTRVVGWHPPAVRYAFTLREFARLGAQIDRGELEGHARAVAAGRRSGTEGTESTEGTEGGPRPADRLSALIPLAAARRGQHPVRPEDDDVVDPYGGPPELYAESMSQLVPAVRAIADLIAPA